MPRALELNPDRLFPADASTRRIARELHGQVAALPIVNPHGHADPAWFADDAPLGDATAVLLAPDPCLRRMLHSQGVTLDHPGVADGDDGGAAPAREAWRLFAARYHLFRGTPSRQSLDWVFAEVFGIGVRLDGDTADFYFDTITQALTGDGFRPRALFDRFGIEVIATTATPLAALDRHAAIRAENARPGGWQGRIVAVYRPDPVVDPEFAGFLTNLDLLSELTGEDCCNWDGYLSAHRQRRAAFAAMGATATDHAHPTAQTANLSRAAASALFAKVATGPVPRDQAELFRAQMLTEMAGMSIDDGLVMQLHPGAMRDHVTAPGERPGRHQGVDIPLRTEYAQALQPLLDCYGDDPQLALILFTLDESTHARELAPLAGHYPCLKLGPAWCHDGPEGMRRFRRMTTETAGFYNTVGFSDDSRAFLSIPARHDVARRVDCGFLAELVVEHRLEDWEAAELAVELAYGLAKRSYRL